MSGSKHLVLTQQVEVDVFLLEYKFLEDDVEFQEKY